MILLLFKIKALLRTLLVVALLRETAAFVAPFRGSRSSSVCSMTSTMEPPSFSPHYSQQDDNNPESIFLDKTFQLEEKEDHANCITELWLLPDHTVKVGQSDGPRTAYEEGSWSHEPHLYPPEYAFAMKLHRTFQTGYKGTDMGEFSFTVSRTYVGSLTEIGSVLGVEGFIYHNEDDDVGSPMGNVGFFSMIDTTSSEDDEEDEDNENGFGNNLFKILFSY